MRFPSASRKRAGIVDRPLRERPCGRSDDLLDGRGDVCRVADGRLPCGEEHLNNVGRPRRCRVHAGTRRATALRIAADDQSHRRSCAPALPGSTTRGPSARSRRRRGGCRAAHVPPRLPMSRSSTGAVSAAPYGQRTTSPARICGAHQWTAFVANIPGRRITRSSAAAVSKRSISTCRSRNGFGC